jgi:hypothetical protein
VLTLLGSGGSGETFRLDEPDDTLVSVDPVMMTVIVRGLSGVTESVACVRDSAVFGTWSRTSWSSMPTE